LQVLKTVLTTRKEGRCSFGFAKALKKNGVDEALIAKSLGLTIEEVRAL